MDFTLTEEQQALQAAARDFARGEMAAVAEETERDAAPLARSWVERYAEMGFLGVNVATEHGGLGLGCQGLVGLLDSLPVRLLRLMKRSQRAQSFLELPGSLIKTRGKLIE